MTNIASLFTFDYDRETQLVPALALMLTPVVSLSLLGMKVSTAADATIGGISLGAIVTILAASLIRNVGKAYARGYFKGYPTTVTCLRLRENAGYTVEQRRVKLESTTGVTLLTKRQELSRPNEADERLQHATNIARDKMRDQKQFPLLWRELKSYGYWRNMCATKPWGIALAVLSMLIPAIAMLLTPHGNIFLHLGAIIVGLVGLMFWTFGVRKKKFVAASDRYASEFFNGLFQL